MDLYVASQEAHDEFVRAVQKVAGHDAKGLQEPLDEFHEAARAVDTQIQALKDEAVALAAEVESLRVTKTALGG